MITIKWDFENAGKAKLSGSIKITSAKKLKSGIVKYRISINYCNSGFYPYGVGTYERLQVFHTPFTQQELEEAFL